jgi:hypothetical protein
MAKRQEAVRLNREDCDAELSIALARWGEKLTVALKDQLQTILSRTGLRVSANELQIIDGSLYVNHAGLLRLARLSRCAGIETEVLSPVSDHARSRWVVRAKVLKTGRSTTSFVGLGDATPDNISPKLRGAELRIAETRAVSRALRKAYAIGLCSTEELGATSESELLAAKALSGFPTQASESSIVSGVPARTHSLAPSRIDRLKILIREHQLDSDKVRQYACQFLGIEDARRATASQLDHLLIHLEQFAAASPTWFQSELDRAVTKSVENRVAYRDKLPSLPIAGAVFAQESSQ